MLTLTAGTALTEGLDAVVLEADEGCAPALPAGLGSPGLVAAIDRARAAAGRFAVRPGDFLDLFGLPEAPAPLVVLANPGQHRRRAADHDWLAFGGRLAAHLNRAGVARAGLALRPPDEALLALLTGLCLRAHSFDKYRTGVPAYPRCTLNHVAVIGDAAALVDRFTREAAPSVEGTLLARDLCHEPANRLTPSRLAEVATGTARDTGMGVEILADDDLARLGMEAFLAVGRGSPQGCRMAVLTWNGLPPERRSEPPLVLVGKGVTFDAGGITLKTGPDLRHNKWDMAGAAAVIGAMRALAARRAPAHVVGIAAMAENMPSGTAQKPGDVVRSMAGRTIEVVFPDGEGRLILADALWYAATRFRPAAIVDVATLTDEVSHVLGTETAGLISNDDRLAERLIAAGRRTGERLWRLPLADEYERYIRSDIADLRNWGDGHLAATCLAGQFLSHFVDGRPWAHLDIAWAAWSLWDSPLAGRGPTGFGVRLLDRFAEDFFS
jgi:leucyl aminopeptidase